MTTAFERRAGTALWTIAAAVSLLLGACSGSRSRREADLDALRHALPGIYTSAASGASNSGAAESVRLAITPIVAQAIGDPVFLVRESAGGNEHLVLAERIWTLALDRQGRVVQQMFVFKEPRRWVGAAEHRDLLLGLLPEDLTPLAGCNLIWQRSPSGFATEAVPKPDPCEPGASVQGQWLDRELKLQGSQLSLTERQVGSDGALSSSAGVISVTMQRHASAGGASSRSRSLP